MTQSEEPIFTFIVYIRHESEDRTGAFNVTRESLVEALKDADPRCVELRSAPYFAGARVADDRRGAGYGS